MNADSHTEDPVVTTVLHDSAADRAHAEHEQAHDQATEVAHAWEHFHENWKFFAGFFTIVLLTVIAFNVNFGTTPLEVNLGLFKLNVVSGNFVATFVLSALRCALIAYFMLSLFKTFSLVRSTFIFCAVFLVGMIILSWWDSELRGIGDPIKDRVNHPVVENHVP